jgi:hypothetical protein
MKIDFKGILEGAANVLVVKQEVEKAAAERKAICDGCEFNSTNAKKNGYSNWRPDEHCTQCGCNLIMKTRCMSCSCPMKYWEEQADKETDQKINDIIK